MRRRDVRFCIGSYGVVRSREGVCVHWIVLSFKGMGVRRRRHYGSLGFLCVCVVD